ncbi:hypothetical protein COP1_036485 [Malus domestica]
MYLKSEKDVLQSLLLMMNEYVASSKRKSAIKKLRTPPEPLMKNVLIRALGLIKAGKCDEAERQLQDIYLLMSW